jgi:hypothetical protein
MSATLADLQRLVDEYMKLQYPDDDTYRALTQADIVRRFDDARAVAIRITELIIDAGVHEGQALR